MSRSATSSSNAQNTQRKGRGIVVSTNKLISSSEINCGTPGSDITPRRRAAIVVLRQLPEVSSGAFKPLSFRQIGSTLGISKSTCNDIYRHALKNAQSQQVSVGTTGSYQVPPISRPEIPLGFLDSDLPGLESEVEEFLDLIEMDDLPTPVVTINAAGPSPAQRSESVEGNEILMIDLLKANCLDADQRTGRRKCLSTVEKSRLRSVVRRDWESRRMTLVDLQLEANLGHVSRSTVYKALRSLGYRSYVEEFKFILDEENMQVRMVF